MLDLKLVQNNPELVAEALRRRNSSIDINDFLALDARRRALLLEVETLKSEQNKASAEVARLKRAGEDASALIASSGELSNRIKTLDVEVEEVKAAVQTWLISVPNMPDASVPDGLDENENVELHRWGTKPEFDFAPKEHWEFGPALGLDFERGSRLVGSRFTILWHWAAKLERALVNFFLDVHCNEQDYIEIYPPAIVNRATMTGTGQLPKFEEDLFRLQDSDLYLIPTAEVPLTNLHSGEVLEEKDLPIGYTAQTQCFRSEAGSYGKDVKGLIRQHQFTKVEMVRFSHPDHSFEELEKLRENAEVLLQKLGLHYRVVTLCTGDMGFSSAKTYDLEVWLPGQNKFREISSCSNCTDFQGRRANIRCKLDGMKKPVFVHTLNGSGLAVGRTLVAIFENYQQADGSVIIPEVLRPYMGGVERITPNMK